MVKVKDTIKNIHTKIKNNKTLAITIISIVSLIVLISTSYAMFITSRSSNQQDMYKTGDLSIEFAEDTTSTISLTNQYPMSDEAGKKQEPYTFTITNNGSYNTTYTIQLNDVTTGLKNSIKYQINGSSPALLSTGNTLDIGTLMPGEKKTFNLRLWINSRTNEENTELTYTGTISVSGQASKIPYFVDNSGANTPELAEGMIPVVYDGSKDVWVVADQTKGWYNYSDQVWANAVTVSDASLRNAPSGTELPMEKINTMWVWIPKYKYKMFNTTGTKTEQEISIVFDNGCQILGDIDLDGDVTEEDSSIAARIFMETETIYTDEASINRADVDGSGTVNMGDAAEIMRIVKGITTMKCINSKPCGLKGDVNLDGFVDDTDHTILMNYLAGSPVEYTEEELVSRADMDSDGELLPYDGTLLQRVVNGSGQNVCPGNIPVEQTNRGTVSCVEGTSTSEICEDTENSMVADGISTYTHPAFKFGEEEINGFWVGKFETSGSATTPTIKPDVTSLVSQNVSTKFTTALKFGNGTMNTSTGEVTFSANSSNVYGLNVTSNTTDTHMMKNTEWGAVAYLSQSRVGKYGNDNYTGANKEIYINNSSSMYTGRSDGAPGSDITTSSLDGTYKYNEYSTNSIKPTITNDSTYPWTIVNGAYKSSTQAVSSSTTNLTYSFTLDSSAELSFDWSVSSENCCDYIYYTITKDGSTLSGTGTDTKIRGTSYGTADNSLTFTSVTKELEAGEYILTFTYRKDGSVNTGTDAGYVKNVSITTPNKKIIANGGGPGASTTGTIYGIYDMSGGAWDGVMSNWSNTIASSGFSVLPNSKYYNKYIGTSSTTITKEKAILGDATLEVEGWYSDIVFFVTSGTPWASRGGRYDYTANSGIFLSSNSNGIAGGSSTFRTTLIP